MKNTLIIILSLTGFIMAQSFDYVGTNKCKSCHKKEKTGAQYKVWEASAHANSFETLKSDESIKIASEVGLEKSPWEAPQCLKCHTTGYNTGGYEVKDAAFWEEKTKRGRPTKEVKRMAGLQAVGCEACHGPGSKYKKRKVMKAIFEGVTNATSVGLLTVDEGTCKQCHNESSPTFKEFNFEEQTNKIAHPYPEGMRAK